MAFVLKKKHPATVKLEVVEKEVWPAQHMEPVLDQLLQYVQQTDRGQSKIILNR